MPASPTTRPKQDGDNSEERRRAALTCNAGSAISRWSPDMRSCSSKARRQFTRHTEPLLRPMHAFPDHGNAASHSAAAIRPARRTPQGVKNLSCRILPKPAFWNCPGQTRFLRQIRGTGLGTNTRHGTAAAVCACASTSSALVKYSPAAKAFSSNSGVGNFRQSARSSSA